MKLKNPFSNHTRNLFLYETSCWLCHRSDRGLELHHIFSRVSSSPCNASVVCLECHSHMGHSEEERVRLLALALRFLARIGYRHDLVDVAFLNSVRGEFDKAVDILKEA